jgi:maltose alpha-D-glucosyltransferase / alpha-amylase
MRDLWYKDAVIYCVDVDAFHDGDGDGIGDFRGLTERLSYIAGIGATCLWLLPFFPTPDRDNGYDITDFYSVDPSHGTLGDFVEFMHAAREHGLRVLIDLVANHTSTEHPWFRSARSSRESPYRDWYVWADEEPPGAREAVVFPGVQESTWTYDEEAGQFYFHRFYEFQPDLNVSNPKVREEIERIMGFWLALGVSGFRVDAAPFLVEMTGIDAGKVGGDPLQYLEDFSDFLAWRRGDAILLAEANIPPEDVPRYFGDDTDRFQLIFHFLANQRLFLALAREQAAPLVEGLYKVPRPPAAGQWAHFLRNHDEIDLGRLTPAERQEVYAAFGPDPSMQLYDRGIRRRLAPMLGDPDRLRMAFSLMLSLPGTPVIWYGDEIGMGDRLDLSERNAVRIPMHWDDSPNAGFSTAEPDRLKRPVVTEGEFAYPLVNVARQRRDPDSLLNFVERAIRQRKECREFGWGDWQVLQTGHPAVFAHLISYRGRTVAAVHNLGGEPVSFDLDVSEQRPRALEDLLGREAPVDVTSDTVRVDLPRYGYRWFRLLTS